MESVDIENTDNPFIWALDFTGWLCRVCQCNKHMAACPLRLLVAERDALRSEHEKFRDDIQRLTIELEASCAGQSLANEEINNLREIVDESAAPPDSRAVHLQTYIDLLKQENQTLVQKVKATSEQVDALEKEKASLLGQVLAVPEDYQRSLARCEELNSQLAEATDARIQLAEQVKVLRERGDGFKQALTEAQAEKQNSFDAIKGVYDALLKKAHGFELTAHADTAAVLASSAMATPFDTVLDIFRLAKARADVVRELEEARANCRRLKEACDRYQSGYEAAAADAKSLRAQGPVLGGMKAEALRQALNELVDAADKAQIVTENETAFDRIQAAMDAAVVLLDGPTSP